jgi:hypothetical protein
VRPLKSTPPVSRGSVAGSAKPLLDVGPPYVFPNLHCYLRRGKYPRLRQPTQRPPGATSWTSVSDAPSGLRPVVARLGRGNGRGATSTGTARRAPGHSAVRHASRCSLVPHRVVREGHSFIPENCVNAFCDRPKTPSAKSLEPHRDRLLRRWGLGSAPGPRQIRPQLIPATDLGIDRRGHRGSDWSRSACASPLLIPNGRQGDRRRSRRNIKWLKVVHVPTTASRSGPTLSLRAFAQTVGAQGHERLTVRISLARSRLSAPTQSPHQRSFGPWRFFV